MKRRRDYKAEYQRRVERGLTKGLSRSQARGHPKASEAHVSAKRRAALDDHRFQVGLRALRQGKSLTATARSIGVSPERLRNFLSRSGAVRKRGRRWMVRDDLPRRVLIYSKGSATVITVGNRRAATVVGVYMNAVKQFLASNDVYYLTLFVGRSVTDIDGQRHPFETDPNTLYRLASTGAESFEQVYRIVI